jgi:hypothetical protein
MSCITIDSPSVGTAGQCPSWCAGAHDADDAHASGYADVILSRRTPYRTPGEPEHPDRLAVRIWAGPDTGGEDVISVLHAAGDDYLPDMTSAEAVSLAAALARAALEARAGASTHPLGPSGCPPWCMTGPHDGEAPADILHMSHPVTVPADPGHPCRGGPACPGDVRAQLVKPAILGSTLLEIYHGDDGMPPLAPAAALCLARHLTALARNGAASEVPGTGHCRWPWCAGAGCEDGNPGLHLSAERSVPVTTRHPCLYGDQGRCAENVSAMLVRADGEDGAARIVLHHGSDVTLPEVALSEAATLADGIARLARLAGGQDCPSWCEIAGEHEGHDGGEMRHVLTEAFRLGPYARRSGKVYVEDALLVSRQQVRDGEPVILLEKPDAQADDPDGILDVPSQQAMLSIAEAVDLALSILSLAVAPEGPGRNADGGCAMSTALARQLPQRRPPVSSRAASCARSMAVTPQTRADALSAGVSWGIWEAHREGDPDARQPSVPVRLRRVAQFRTGVMFGHRLMESAVAAGTQSLADLREVISAFEREASHYPESTACRKDRERAEARAEGRIAAALRPGPEIGMMTTQSERITALANWVRIIDHDENESGPWPVTGYAAILDLMADQLILAPWLSAEPLRAEILAFGAAIALSCWQGNRVVGPGGFRAGAGWIAITAARMPEFPDGPGNTARKMLDRCAESGGQDERCDHSVTFEIVVPPTGAGRLVRPLASADD